MELLLFNAQFYGKYFLCSYKLGWALLIFYIYLIMNKFVQCVIVNISSFFKDKYLSVLKHFIIATRSQWDFSSEVHAVFMYIGDKWFWTCIYKDYYSRYYEHVVLRFVFKSYNKLVLCRQKCYVTYQFLFYDTLKYHNLMIINHELGED